MNKSKTIIVTGGSKGIGKAIAFELAKEGYNVHLLARIKKDLELVQDVIKENYGAKSEFTVLDLSNRLEIEKFSKSWNQPIYGIINNAGICKTERLDEEKGSWDEVIRTNLEGPYFLTKYLSSKIEENGRIINISSQLGKEGRASYGAYCASKFGIIGLTKVWAKELGKKGITVNAVCPGWVSTDMSKIDLARIAKEKGVSEKDFYSQICEPLELKRFTTPEEVANLVVFLASQKSSGITGRDFLLNTIWNQE